MNSSLPRLIQSSAKAMIPTKCVLPATVGNKPWQTALKLYTMDEKIIEAIKIIVDSTDCEVEYEVKKIVENVGGLFRKSDQVRMTLVNIKITGK